MLKYLIPAFLWAVIILLLSAHPQMGVSKPWWMLQPDKFAHAGAYALLAFLLQYGFRQVYVPVILGTIYGIIIEFLQQAFFYGRQLDVFDMLANLIGCLIGVWIFPWVAPRLSHYFVRK
jgi:VanZ family protein